MTHAELMAAARNTLLEKGLAATVDLILEEVAKAADEHSIKWHGEWRAGHKSNTHLEGKSDGADEIATAIRGLKGNLE